MRLIDVDELREQMKELCEKRAEEANMTGNRTVCVTWDDAIIFIKNAPTIDAVPVKHGQWKGKPIAGYSTVRCSECGEAFMENNGKWNYCPHCGAKMENANG